MSLTATVNKGDYEKHPEGMFAARCYQVIDLGTHLDERWGKRKHLVRVVFETAETMGDGRPFTIGTRYTLSLHEKAQLRKDLESWFGKALNIEAGFDMKSLIGKTAMLNIAHSADGEYANIRAINPLPKGMQAEPAVNDPVYYEIGASDESVLAKLGKKTQEMIAKSDERTGAKDAAPSARSSSHGKADDPFGDDFNEMPPF